MEEEREEVGGGRGEGKAEEVGIEFYVGGVLMLIKDGAEAEEEGSIDVESCRRLRWPEGVEEERRCCSGRMGLRTCAMPRTVRASSLASRAGF